MFPPRPRPPYSPDDESKNPAPEDTLDPRPHDTLYAHRLERFIHLGFDEGNAALLASARNHGGWYLDWAQVQKALRGGATHSQCVVIFA